MSWELVWEVSVFETLFFLYAWFFEAVVDGEYGWYSKAVMIVLGVLGLLLHGARRRYNLLPRYIGFSLKWSFYAFFRPYLCFRHCFVVYLGYDG